MNTAMILAAATLLGATGASAQTNATTTRPTAPVTKPKAAQSAAPALRTAPAAGSGRVVAATTKTGKKINYDCSKKGNATKKACKG